MEAKKLIEMALVYRGMTKADLARNLGWSQQLLAKRIRTGKFTTEEWNEIAKAMDAELLLGFRFPDGKTI